MLLTTEAILFAPSARLNPFGIALKGREPLIALGQRFPLQDVDQIGACLPDRHRPEAELSDAVLLEQPHRGRFKSLQQIGKTAGGGMIHA